MYESANCKSIFRNGKQEPDHEEFTQVWVSLINQMERAKAVLTRIP